MRVEVFGKEDCTYCSRAKALLEQKNISYEYYDVEAEPALKESMMQRSGGYQKVPQIFIDNEFVAGYDGLRDWFKKHQ